jgi:Domain of unknown function (DUF1707)
MPSTSSQQWSRRVRYSDQDIRVSDAERNAVTERLAAHYSDGRLDQAEFDERVGRTMAAKTRGDLTGLFDDLPETETGAGADGPRGPVGPSAPYQVRRRRGGGGIVRPLLLLALIFICANVAWHAFTSLFFFQPLVWAFVIAAAIIIASRRSHRHDR